MSAAYRIGAAQWHGDSVRIPSVWLAFGVSVLLHALLLWSGWLPDLRSLTLEDPTKGRSEGALHPQLEHFLQNRSYPKALAFLDSRGLRNADLGKSVS